MSSKEISGNPELSIEDLRRITKYKQPKAICNHLKKHGFSFMPDRNGYPQITWEHYNAVLNGTTGKKFTQDTEPEPDFGAIDGT